MLGRRSRRAIASLFPLLAIGCATTADTAAIRDDAEQMVSRSFSAPDPALLKRLNQDEAQRICSKIDHAPLGQDESAEVVKLARASIKYPSSGKLMGDWKHGEQLAHDGAGDRIQSGRLENRKENGGLCQNCHALEPGEVNVGNVGPGLTRYGVQRGSSEEAAKYTYEKIYNAWAYVPCSNMPRLGANGHLTPEQIADLVAYLVDPQSPLNAR